MAGETAKTTDLNQALNEELERFNFGTATGSRAGTSFDPPLMAGHTQTYTYLLEGDPEGVEICHYTENGTGIQLFQVTGQEVPEIIAGKTFKKASPHDLLVEINEEELDGSASSWVHEKTPVDLIDKFKYIMRDVDAAGRIADEEEIRAVIGAFQTLNDSYERKETTDLSRETNRRLLSMIDEMFAGDYSHPMAAYSKSRAGESDREMIKIVDHELFVHITKVNPKEGGPRYVMVLDGQTVPENLRGKEVRIEPGELLHTIGKPEVGYYLEESAANFNYYNSGGRRHRQPKRTPQNDNELTSDEERPLLIPHEAVLREDQAVSLADTLERYAKDRKWQVNYDCKDTTPPTPQMLTQTRGALENVLHGQASGWRLSQHGAGLQAVYIRPGKRKGSTDLGITITGGTEGTYEVGISGPASPASLKNLRLTFNFMSGANTVRPLSANETARHDTRIKLGKAMLNLAKGERSTGMEQSWRESYQQIEDLLDLLQTS